MRRPTPSALAVALLAALSARSLAFGEPPGAAPAGPTVTLATDAEAEAALAKFKEDFKAKGLKGDDRLSQKDFALQALAKVQHLKVVDALAAASRDADETVRMLGVIYLGDQAAFPGAAGKRVVEAMTRGAVEDAFRMTCLQQVGRLRFLGAREPIRDALKSQNYAVKKSALAAVGRTGDLRMLREVVAVIGLKLPEDGGADTGDDKQSSGKEVVQEGSSWEGAEASVDTGTPGDGDQKAAEAQAKAQAAANQAAAQKGGGAGGEGGARGAGGASRSPKELIPTVLGVLKQLTGKSFSSPGEFKAWYAANRETLATQRKALDDAEKAQKAAAK